MLSIGTDGDSRFAELEITPLLVGPSMPPAQLLVLSDVTEERRADERLKAARTVFDTANEGIVITHVSGEHTVIDVNDAFSRLTGRLREDVVGKDNRLLRCDRHSPEFYEAIKQGLLAAGAWKGEVWQTRADGSEFPSWVSLAIVQDVEGHPTQAIGIFTDLTEIREAEKFEHDATHDDLTGLVNRSMLDDRLDQGLSRATRWGTGLGVLFLDLDHFKDVNDAYGHALGDQLLVDVAKRLVSTLRASDTVARTGGDEFVIVIADTSDSRLAEDTARRLLDAVALPYRLGDEGVHATASIGVAVYPKDGPDASTLSEHADLAMYGAKRLGRNRIEFFSERLLSHSKQHGSGDEESRSPS